MLRIYRFCLLALLLAGAAHALPPSPVEWSVQLQAETLTIDAKTRSAQPAQRASSNPAFLELSFPKAKMSSAALSKAIDKGLIQKVQTLQEGENTLVRVYVLTKPKATLTKTATGYRYSVRLIEPATGASTVTAQGKPAANNGKPPKPPVASEPPRVAPRVSTQPPTPPVVSSPPTVNRGPSPKTPVSFVFRDKPLATAIEEMADKAGFSAQLDPKLSGVVNLSLSEVPFDKALMMLLEPYGDSVTADIGYTTITVTKTSAGSAEPPPVAAGPEVLEYYPLKNKDAQKMMEALKKAVPEVSYRVDPLLNVLLVRGPREEVIKVGEYLKSISKK